MSAALQPPVSAPPTARAPTASHTALPDVQISFNAMLAQSFEPTSPTRAFAETGVLGDKTPAVVRETAAAPPAGASFGQRDVATSTIAAQRRPLGVFRSAPTSSLVAGPLPQHQAPARATDLGNRDAPQARVLVPHSAAKAPIPPQVNQLRARADSAPKPAPLQRMHPSAFFVALSETASGVRVQARVAAMSPTERGRLRQQIHALLAQHGIHSATIEVE